MPLKSSDSEEQQYIQKCKSKASRIRLETLGGKLYIKLKDVKSLVAEIAVYSDPEFQPAFRAIHEKLVQIEQDDDEAHAELLAFNMNRGVK